jgi:pyruvate dehydrogenase phosphatase
MQSAKSGKETLPDLKKHPMALPTMSPALSGTSFSHLKQAATHVLIGSCALLAVIDTAHKNLYVACTGDSRAVAGVWEEGPDGNGKWRVEVLSEDQTGRNENEVARSAFTPSLIRSPPINIL